MKTFRRNELLAGRRRFPAWRFLPAPLAVLLGAVLALASAAPGAEAAPRGCKVVITATGKLSLKISDSPSGAVSVTWGGMTGPRFTVRTSRGGNRRLCDRNAVGGSPTVTTNKAGPQLFMVLNESVRAARLEAGGSNAASYRDYRTMVGAIRNDILNTAMRDIAIDIGTKVIDKILPVPTFLEDKGIARATIRYAVKVLIDGYLKGKDLDGIGKDLAVDIAKDAAGGAAGLTEDQLADILKRMFSLAANEIKELIKDKPEAQSGTASFEDDTCKWFANAFWSPTSETYNIQFTKECGDTSAIGRVAVTSTAGKPGETKTVTVRALDIMGLPMQVTAVTVRGLEAVMAPGDSYVVAGLPGPAPTVTFTIAKPRKDMSYAFTALVTAVNRGVTSRGTARGSVRVLNVAPRITGLPDGAKADPGRNMTLRGKVTVVDDNADRNNPGEVPAGFLRLTGHPAGLDTQFRLNRVARFSQDSFDGATGTYVFSLTANAGNVKKPHEHRDDLRTGVRAEDDNRAMAENRDGITLEVNDVLPKIRLRIDPGRNYHRNDGVQVAVSGRITDDNGADDIETAEIDATAAGGGVWNLAAIEKARDKEGIDFAAPKFAHVNTEGDWPIRMKVSDGDPAPNEVTRDDAIHVGNLGPEITGVGYVYEGGIGDQRHKVCPGQIFTAGAIVTDPEDDPLLVRATIKETGQSVVLVRQPGTRNYIGTLAAPGTPGEYTIEYTAVEKPSPLIRRPLSAVPMVTGLTVEPCEDLKVDDYILDVRVSPEIVCPGEAIEVTAVATIFYTDKTRATIHPPGTASYFLDRQTIGEARPVAKFTSLAPPFGPQTIDLALAIAGSTLAYQASVAVIPCDEPPDLIGFADWAADTAGYYAVGQRSEEAELWAGACYASMEMLPEYVPPPGRDPAAVIGQSTALAARAAALAGAALAEAADRARDYAEAKSVEAELLAKGAVNGAARKARKATGLLEPWRAALQTAANYRSLENLFRAHAARTEARARGEGVAEGAKERTVNPRYCPEKIRIAVERRRPPDQAGDGGSAANVLLLMGIMGAMGGDGYGDDYGGDEGYWRD